MPHLAIEPDITEKDNHVLINFALDANAAKEADCVADGRIGSDVNVAKKRDGIAIGARSRRAGREDRGGN